MYKLSIFIQCIVFIFISKIAYSFSSSSYLIANSAMSFFDYEKANTHYENSDIKNFNNSDLLKKLITYVNTDSFKKALTIANEILQGDDSNQEAWLVYLTNAKLNSTIKPFYEFIKQNEIEKLPIIKFILEKMEQYKIVEQVMI